MTPRQKQCLDFIVGYHNERGVSPSYDDIKYGLGLVSKSGVHRLVHALAERGHITFLRDRARSIAVRETDDTAEYLRGFQAGIAFARQHHQPPAQHPVSVFDSSRQSGNEVGSVHEPNDTTPGE